MEVVDEAKAECVAARARYDPAKVAFNNEALKLDNSKVYALPGAVLMRDVHGCWIVKPLEVLCGA